VGRKAGITEEQLLDLAEFERSTYFNEREKRALRLTVALTRTPAEVPDELFAALRGEFSERELVELTNAIAWENYRARFNRTFAIESENFSKGQFARFRNGDVSFGGSSSRSSITASCRATPTCGAASPTLGAARIVSSMSFRTNASPDSAKRPGASNLHP
jgi:hypothetical protein